jgi:hypothetical protein
MSITIYDGYGFYAEAFEKVVDGLVKNDYATKDEHNLIKGMKELRKDKDAWRTLPFEKIKEYTKLELSTGSRAMTLLRDGFDGLPGGGIRLRMWSGAGAAAGALIEKMELKKRHFPTNFKVKTQHPGDEQKWAHAAFHAGHIECLQQGYAPEQELHKLDIVGAYPWGCIALPSMRDGEYESVKVPLYKIEQANILSMFKVGGSRRQSQDGVSSFH